MSDWNAEDHILAGLLPLVVSIDAVHPMRGNPQVGNLSAIASSLESLGQHRPLVATADGTILIGNHTYQAARNLGWEQIAVLYTEDDDETAVVRALTDNRTSELSHTDPDLLHDLLCEVVDVAPDLFDALGWDEFELAVLDERALAVSVPSEYVPPVLVTQPGAPLPLQSPPPQVQTEDGAAIYRAPEGIDQRAAIVTGAPAVGQGTPSAMITYSLVFDDSDQHKRWFDFIRCLRADPAYDGTIAQRLIDFIENHADF